MHKHLFLIYLSFDRYANAFLCSKDIYIYIYIHLRKKRINIYIRVAFNKIPDFFCIGI